MPKKVKKRCSKGMPILAKPRAKEMDNIRIQMSKRAKIADKKNKVSKRERRNLLVKQFMKQMGMTLPEASRYIKKEKLDY